MNFAFFSKDIIQNNADLAEYLIEMLADRDDIAAVKYWSKSTENIIIDLFLL